MTWLVIIPLLVLEFIHAHTSFLPPFDTHCLLQDLPPTGETNRSLNNRYRKLRPSEEQLSWAGLSWEGAVSAAVLWQH